MLKILLMLFALGFLGVATVQENSGVSQSDTHEAPLPMGGVAMCAVIAGAVIARRGHG